MSVATETRPKVRLADRDGALAWLFLLPSVIYIIALVAIPFVLAIGFAFRLILRSRLTLIR